MSNNLPPGIDPEAFYGPPADATPEPTAADIGLADILFDEAHHYTGMLPAYRECVKWLVRAHVASVTAPLHAELAAIEAGLSKEYQAGDKRSGDLIDDFTEFLEHHRRVEIKLTVALADAAAIRKELAEVTAAFQKECDHEFETEDHSFSHEFGTERIFVCRCTKCGKHRDADDGPFPEDDDEPRIDQRELRDFP